MSQLRVTSSNLNGGVFELNGEYFTIGRESDNAIHLDHTSVSKHHAILKIDNDDLKLFDLHSTNGTIVNGEPRVVSHLHNGDKILLGEVELRFESNNKATQPVPTPPSVTPLKAEPKPVLFAIAPPPIPIAAPKVEPKPTPPPPTPPKPAVPATVTPPSPIVTAQASPLSVPAIESKPPPLPPVVTAAVAPPAKALAGQIQDGAAVLARPPGRLAGLLGLFRHSRSRETTPEPPASREKIHVELSQRFGTMGLELPKPPPAEKPKTALAVAVEVKKVIAPVAATTEVKPTAIILPPPPKPVEPKPELPPREERLQSKPAEPQTERELKTAPPAPPTPLPREPVKSEIDRLLRTPPPATLPEPLPAVVIDNRMARRRLTCFMSLAAGGLVVALGYSLNAIPLKFLGLLVAMGGLISLVFTLRFGSLVAPPRKRPPAV